MIFLLEIIISAFEAAGSQVLKAPVQAIERIFAITVILFNEHVFRAAAFCLFKDPFPVQVSLTDRQHRAPITIILEMDTRDTS